MASTTRLGMLCARQLRQPTTRVLLRPEPVRQSFPIVHRIAPFTTTSTRKILPPGPQVIHGGVNDPAPVPEPQYASPCAFAVGIQIPTHGSYHWIAERAVSAGLIPLTLAPFAAGSLNPTTDAIFVALLLIHSHMGFKACVIDYFPTWEWPKSRKFFDWLLVLATLGAGVGLYEFETNDVGVTEAAKRIWRAGKENDATIEKVKQLTS